jgi:hypothetical protein
MTTNLAIQTLICTAWAVAVLTPAVGRAQSPNMMNIMPTYRTGDTNHPSPVQAKVEMSYTASGKAKFLGTKSGDSDAFSATVNVFAPLPLSEKWIMPLGLGSQNIFLDSVPGVPVPDQIHTLSFTTGIGHRLNDDWMIMGMFSPTLYKFSDVGGNDVGFSGGVNAMWRYSPSLTLRFGLMISPDSDLKLLPMIGADWRINEEWDLRLMFPQPRLIYQPDDRWSFHVGANMVGTTFRGSDTLGTFIGRPQYNDALGTYRDIRVGGGVGYQFNKTFGVEVEAGYSVSRQIDYTRIGETVKFDPAPYVRLGVNVGF